MTNIRYDYLPALIHKMDPSLKNEWSYLTSLWSLRCPHPAISLCQHYPLHFVPLYCLFDVFLVCIIKKRISTPDGGNDYALSFEPTLKMVESALLVMSPVYSPERILSALFLARLLNHKRQRYKKPNLLTPFIKRLLAYEHMLVQ